MPIKSQKVDADIISQTLAEVITRNKYGVLQHYAASGSGELGYTTLFSVTGKGIIYGGFLNTSHKDAFLRITIDGTIINTPSHDSLNTLGIISPEQYLVFSLFHDAVNDSYNMGIKSGITFETDYKVELYKPITFTVYNYRLLFALV